MVAINIDWLSFSVLLAVDEKEKAEGARLSCPEGFSLVECSGTNLYKRRVLVLNVAGEKMLTLLLEPYSSIMQRNSMFVEVANKWLYGSLEWVMPLLESIHLFSFQSLSRLDVCGDFTPDVEQIRIIDGLQDNSMYVTGKREGVMFHDYSLSVSGGVVVRSARQISYGSKNSNIHWKLYNKSLEVYEVDAKGRKWCTKPWIEEVWKAARLEPDNVWRLEVSIMGSAKYKWRGEKLNWDFVLSRAYVVDFYMDIVDTRFIVRANQGHKCKKWDEVIDLFVWDNPEAYRVRQRLVGREQMHTDHAVTMRTALQQLDRPEVRYNSEMADIWLSALEETIREANLWGYFLRNMGITFESWKENYIRGDK